MPTDYLDSEVLLREIKARMREPEFSKWYLDTLRGKLADLKTAQADRDRGPILRITTRDLSATASFLAVIRGRRGGGGERSNG